MTDRPTDRCGNPQCDGSHLKTWAQHEEEAMETILKHGHQVIGVFGEEPEDFISYSVGRCVRHKPEIITTGPLPVGTSGFMINEAARMADETPGMVEDGFVFGPDALIQGHSVQVVEVDPTQYPLNQIWNLFGEDADITVLQLVWPDKQGHFPDEPDYAGIAQPIHRKESA